MLESKFLKYIERNRILKLDHMTEKWDCEMEDITELICAHYDEFANLKFVDQAVYLDYNDVDQWYYELGRGVGSGEDRTFKRHKKAKANHIDKHLERWAGKEDRHISVFMHDEKWKKDYNDKNSKVKAAYVYLELDRGGGLEDAIYDANEFLKQFPYHRGVVTWFSGNSSIHIGIPTEYFGDPICTNSKACGRGRLFYNLAHAIGGNIRYDNDYFDPHLSKVSDCEEMYESIFEEEPLDDPQKLRQSLEHFDPNLFYMNSMVRMPGSVHEKSGKPKQVVELPAYDPDNSPEIKPYLLHLTYQAWKPVKKPGRRYKSANVSKHAPFVIRFFDEHIQGFDPDDMNHSGWVNSLYSPFYDDNNPDVSVCIDPESNMFGAYRDFGNADDNSDFVGFVAKIIKRSRRSAMDYIKAKS